jgi:hypothetical protein
LQAASIGLPQVRSDGKMPTQRVARAATPMRWATRLTDTSERMSRYHLAAIASCVAAGLLALTVGSAHRIGTFGVETDFYANYAPEAARLLAGESYTYRTNPPGYVVLLAATSLVTGGDMFAAGRLLSALATPLFGALTYLVLGSLVPARVALAATLLALLAVFPHPILASTDVVGAAAMLAPIWLILRPSPRPALAATLAGLLAGLAFLIRYNAIFLVVGGIAALLVFDVQRQSVRRRIASASLLILAWTLTTAPWLAWNQRHYGSLLSSTAPAQMAAHFFYEGGDADGTNVRAARTRFTSMADVVRHDPVRVAVRYVKDVAYLYPARLAEEAVHFPAYLFLGGGLLLLLLRGPSRSQASFLVLCALGYLLMGLVGFVERYYLFLHPLLFLCVAYFLFEAPTLASGPAQGKRSHLGWVLSAAVAVPLAWQALDSTRATLADEPRHLIPIAQWLRERSDPEDLVIARKPHLAYAAGLRQGWVSATAADEFLEGARRMGARYVVYSPEEGRLWPGLESLRDPEALPPGFTLVRRHEATGLLIYEIRDE